VGSEGEEGRMKKVSIPGSDYLTVGIITVTPQVARDLLLKGKRNREVSKVRVRQYARTMRNGEWVVAQPLLFDDQGAMIDGQHRCRAVVDSGVPVEFLAIYGYVRDSVFGRLDDTRPRSLRDWMHDRGEELPAVTATVTKLMHRHSLGRIPFSTGGDVALTGPEGLVFLDEHPDIRQAIHGPGTVNPYASRATCCFLYCLFCKSDKALANVFFVDLITGDREGESDPIYLLRSRLQSNRYAKIKMRQVEMGALIIKAWNATKAGQPMRLLKWNAAGPNAEYFPEVH